jgi:hypothetical protein
LLAWEKHEKNGIMDTEAALFAGVILQIALFLSIRYVASQRVFYGGRSFPVTVGQSPLVQTRTVPGSNAPRLFLMPNAIAKRAALQYRDKA